MASPSEAAADVLRLLADRPATLGRGRLLCVDGPAGSGKTTLGRACAAAYAGAGTARLVHMDDLYDGWSGLGSVAEQLTTLLRPLAAGEPGHYRRYDWHAGAFAETVRVPPVDLLVVEGVGSGSRPVADLCTLLVWVTAPSGLRLARGLERDGEHLRQEWERWRQDEEAHFAADGTPARADLVVDGTGLGPPRPTA